MKLQFLKALIFFVPIMLILVGCNAQDDKPFAWEGDWVRTVNVPKGVQGRCVNEFLTIKAKSWDLKVVVHSTYECNQPFLELFYSGSVNEIKIKKNTSDRDVRFQIFGIHLAGMIDVAGDDRAVLSESAVESLSSRYVPKEHEFFEQKVHMAPDGSSMNADIYRPVIEFAMPGYPDPIEQRRYSKVK